MTLDANKSKDYAKRLGIYPIKIFVSIDEADIIDMNTKLSLVYLKCASGSIVIGVSWQMYVYSTK